MMLMKVRQAIDVLTSRDLIVSCDLIAVAECVTNAKDRLDDLLTRMITCELDDFEIVSAKLLQGINSYCSVYRHLLQ